MKRRFDWIRVDSPSRLTWHRCFGQGGAGDFFLAFEGSGSVSRVVVVVVVVVAAVVAVVGWSVDNGH